MDLDDYRPYENWLGGNDLACLERAKQRLHAVLRNPELPARDRERCTELLKAESIVDYERIRDAWSEVVTCIAPAVTQKPKQPTLKALSTPASVPAEPESPQSNQ